MSDPLTSNRDEEGSNSNKIEPSGGENEENSNKIEPSGEENEENSNKIEPSGKENEENILVQLSNKTLALLNPYGDNSSLHDSDKEPGAKESTYWGAISNLFFNAKGNSENRNNINSNKQTQPRRRRSKPLDDVSGPSVNQLSAPYIEEHRPERYEYIRRPSESAPTNDVGRVEQLEEDEEEEEEDMDVPRNRVRKRFRKAIAMSKLKKAKRTHLRDTSNLGVIVFPSPISVPYLWARRDYKGHKAPPILFDALRLAITDSHDYDSYHLQAVFRIELEYGDVKWVIKRLGFDFVSLYFSLIQRRDLPSIPKIPNGLYRWFSFFRKAHPRHHEPRRTATLEKRNQLEDYLIQVIRTLCMHVSYELNEFLELSAISITRDMGWKGKECYLESKIERLYKPVCSFRKSKWITEWVIVRDSYIAFCSHISSATPADVFLLDRYFKCDKIDLQGFKRALKRHDRISIENSSRRIELKGEQRKLSEFLESIQRVMQSSPWVKQHRFDSYAPIRKDVKVKWYVDGKDYFFAVSEAILAAKTEIYIEDWWLSPELYLRRPPSENEDFRLDRLLKRKAEEGVMIYIVVYKEVKYSLALDSNHTKTTLQELHNNIRVQRHPDHGPDGTMFWAHHEKIVVVDCRLAFIGGLDLCFGRYDTHIHEMVDWYPDNEQHTIWPGQDYSNPRIKDFANVAEYENPLIDKSQAPRMPWHDISLGMVGTPARDVARHFVQRWNFIKDEKAYEREKFPFLTPKGEYVNTRDESKFEGTCKVQLLRSSSYWSSGIKLERSIYNAYCHLIRTSKHFIYIENQFFITTTENDPVIKNRIGECIVERVKEAHKNHEKFRIFIVMPLLPSFESDLNSSDAGTIRMVMHWQYVSICRGGKAILEKISEAGIDPEKYITLYSLRGYDKIDKKPDEEKPPKKRFSRLSTSTKGDKTSEKRKSEDNTNESNSGVQLDKSPSITLQTSQNKNKNNNLDDKLLQSPTEIRVSEESIGSGKESSIRHPLEDSFSDEKAEISPKDRIGGEPTIPSGMEQMDPGKTYVTEEIYIHSKLMIVDDRYVICGSANINDRSQLGDRDSEIAVIIEDSKEIETRMNGKPYQASKFAYTLRSNLFKEHLGLLEAQDHSSVTKSCYPPLRTETLYDIQCEEEKPVTSILDGPSRYPSRKSKYSTKEDLVVMDPLSDEFYEYWLTTAHNNTDIYRSVFKCVPDDNVLNWDQYKKFVPDPAKVPTGHVANVQATEEEIGEKLEKIRGNLVIFPTKFLSQENLLGSVMSNAIPAEIFT